MQPRSTGAFGAFDSSHGLRRRLGVLEHNAVKSKLTILVCAGTFALGGGLLWHFHGRAAASLDARPDRPRVGSRRADQRAISRWENEGGAVLTG
jgi:hypothetical protein